jgi:hypothetical protein
LCNFRPRTFWCIPAQANTRSFKEIFQYEQENIALFSPGVDVVPQGGGAGCEDAAADVLV